MTNIVKALVRLREERRDAQNQVQKLGEAISVLEKLTRGTLGENQTGQESSLRAGRAAGCATLSRETEARRIFPRTVRSYSARDSLH
jgi:hypothetical protein